ncbi:multidrug transporter [Natronorubrum aibiense]|uniref:Multidrug transporter n=1 Tax=Natronorubrum aibiense TaxID=348826 RepID=A0A5P9P6X3_9EURY|nr:multidrug transporter [Natronorubrum aibiense]QFU83697.1 multidrug transporter [Natronorubrum aibiense]
MASGYTDQSAVVTAFGLLIAIVAVVGTQVFGWEWGGGQLVPTLIGVVVAGIAILVVFRGFLRYSNN